MSHQHQSLLDRRPRAAQLAVVLYELCTVLSACKHPYGLLVCGGCLNPLRSTGCRVVPVHLFVLLPEKDEMHLMFPVLRAPKQECFANFAVTEFSEVRNLLCSARARSRLRSISAVSPSGSESP